MSDRAPLVAFGGAAAMALAMGIGRFAYTPILPAMHRETGLSPDAAGLLAMLNFLGYTLGTLWPLFARRLGYAPGPKTAVRWGVAACLACALAMAAGDAVPLWGLVRFAAGVASAITMIYASALVLDALARAGAQTAAGIHYGGVGAGITASGLMVLVLERAAVGWRGMWVGAALLILLLAPLVLLTVTRRARGARAAPPAPAAEPAARARNPWWLVGAYGCSGLGFIVSGTFLPLIAAQDPATAPYAAFSWMLLGIAAIASNVFWARVAARRGATVALVAQYALQALGVVLPVLSATPAAIAASGLILGATFMGIVTVANAEARTLAPQRTAEMLALMTACYSVGQIVGPPVAGLIATRSGSFDGGLLLAAAALLAGIVLLALDRRAAARAGRG